MILGGQMVDVQ